MLTTSIRIIAVDLSYRDTGVCLMDSENGVTTIYDAFSISNPPMDCSFDGLKDMSIRINNTIDIIDKMDDGRAVVIVEMPSFSQNAKGAITVGLVWAAVHKLDAILVEPSFLKIWSDSKKGDGKTEVKEKVKSLTSLSRSQLANNNVVDAVGIGLAFCEMIYK